MNVAGSSGGRVCKQAGRGEAGTRHVYVETRYKERETETAWKSETDAR